MSLTTKMIQKIYPTPEELSLVCSKVLCPEDNCTAVFQSTSNLNMHLIKHHKVAHNGLNIKTGETQYFCPVTSCLYYKNSEKHFTKLKYLKQHFLKVHASKDFSCRKCGKRFSTETFKALHMKNCGKLFTCLCGAQYTSSEAILTHCKRKGKGHLFIEKHTKEIKDTTLKSIETNAKNSKRLIYPKISSDMSFPIHYIAAVALSELSAPCNLSKVVDKGVQTEGAEFGFSKNLTTTLKCEKKRKNSQQTQTTGKCKKLKISAQTQTSSEYLKHKAKTNPKSVVKKRKKSMETQTKGIDCLEKLKPEWNLVENKKSKPEHITPNEEKAKKWLWDSQFFIQKDILSSGKATEVKSELFAEGNELNLCSKEPSLNECNISLKNNGSQYGSEQGTHKDQLFDLNRLCNIETQTEIDAFLTECNEDTNFTLCSTTETQTTDDFDSLLYSSMCTQTCEEVDQLFNFNFVHIETQTAWPDLNDCNNLGD